MFPEIRRSNAILVRSKLLAEVPGLIEDAIEPIAMRIFGDAGDKQVFQSLYLKGYASSVFEPYPMMAIIGASANHFAPGRVAGNHFEVTKEGVKGSGLAQTMGSDASMCAFIPFDTGPVTVETIFDPG